ncbi:hypothetical protein GCM10023116_39990 [Kistimonas scapharcae]|uniref:Serine aminopeptidase S33 domain-containing protein n=1 Tax=Kistimonas scapharcae TaxID=1036133 RepID=A0ABP8V8X1_9GAMM
MRNRINEYETLFHTLDYDYDNNPPANQPTFCHRTLSLIFDTTKHLTLDFIQSRHRPLKILKITILVAVTPILLILFPLTLIYIIQKIVQDLAFFPIQRRFIDFIGEIPTTEIEQTLYIQETQQEYDELLLHQEHYKNNLQTLEREKKKTLDGMDKVTFQSIAPEVSEDLHQALQTKLTEIEISIANTLINLQQLKKQIIHIKKRLTLLSLQSLEHIVYRNNAQEIHTYLYKARVSSPDGLLIIFHGNSITAQLDALTRVAVTYAKQQHCLFVEYPGYNSAEGGIYSEREFLDTAETAYNMAVTYFPHLPISLFGQSIGTGAAAYLAGQHPSKIERVILHAPYTSLTDLVGYHVNPCLAAIFSYYRVNTQDYLVDYVTQNPAAEVVLIHADEEPVIPQAHSDALNTACQRAKEASHGQQTIVLFKLHRDYGHAGLPEELAERLFCTELPTLDPAPFRQPPAYWSQSGIV